MIEGNTNRTLASMLETAFSCLLFLFVLIYVLCGVQLSSSVVLFFSFHFVSCIVFCTLVIC